VLECEQVVLARLDADQQCVEGGDVDAGRVVAALQRLHERRAGPGEGVEHLAAARDVSVEERLDELWDELAEVRVEPMNVFGPFALRKRLFRPRQLEVDLAVDGILRSRHDPGRVRLSSGIS
jgi:hypothetical protein